MRTLLTLLVAGVIVAGPEPASAQDSSARERRDSAQRSSATSQRQESREQVERTTRTFRGGQELQLANGDTPAARDDSVSLNP